MITKGIRGAITVDFNTRECIREAVIELLTEIFKLNELKKENISHIIFTLTPDLNAAFPAEFARKDFGLTETAMMCYNELNVPEAVKKCLRILVVTNCDTNFKPRFVYLKGASNLRS